MFTTALKSQFGCKSWCVTLSAVVLAACGGGSGSDSGEGATSASNADQTPTVAVGEAGTKTLLASGTVSTAAVSPGPYGQDPTKYTLTFSDEFSGTSLDTSKWNDHIWYDPPSSTNDYGVSGGYLRIWPQADANGEFKERILTTAGKFSQTYGYFEMEAKLPIGHGPWPAFWLLNSDNPDVGEPEIDIMEAYPGDNTGYWADAKNHPIRYGTSFYQNGNGANPPGLQGTQGNYTGDLSTAFHKYGLKWEASKLSFYFDGRLVYTANVSMSKKMYILLDMQYGSASGSVDGTTPLGPNNSFQINYARAWKFK